jgi:hypothetical protein
MENANLSSRQHAWLLLLLGLLTGLPGMAMAQDPDLQEAWYRVEIILFERTTAAGSREDTAQLKPRAFPNTPLAFVMSDEVLQAHLRLPEDQLRAMQLRLPAAEIVANWPEDQRPDHWETYLPLLQRRSGDFDQFRTDAPTEPLTTPELSAAETVTEEADAAADTAEAREGAEDESVVEPSPADLVEPLSERERLARQVAAFERDLRQRAYTPLPAGQHQLNSAAQRLRASGQMQIIDHRAWIQPAPARENPEPVLYQVGDWRGDRYAYEGTLSLTRGRFLHFHVQLWRDPENQPLRAERPFESLDESRRMRSSELHYLDHPRFGILVRVDPITLPDVLPPIDEAPGQPDR